MKFKIINTGIGRMIKASLLAAVLLISIYYISRHPDEFRGIFRLGPGRFALLSLLTAGGFMVDGWIFKTLLSLYGVKLRFLEWFGLTMLNRYANYLPVRGGPVLRGGYLKKIHGLTYGNFASILLCLSLIQLFCLSVMAAAGMLFVYRQGGGFNFYILAALAVSAIIASALLFSPEKFSAGKSGKIRRLFAAVTGWVKPAHGRRTLAGAAILMALSVLMNGFKIFLIYPAISGPVPLSAAVFMASAGSLSFLVAITPAALGIREAMTAYSAVIVGENFASAAGAASVDRVISMIWIFLLGFFFSLWYAGKIKTAPADNRPENIKMIAKPVIIISSLGRTGTTFFTSFFEKYFKEAASVHEPGMIDFKTMSLGTIVRTVAAYGFTGAVLNKMTGRWDIMHLSNRRLAGKIEKDRAARELIAMRSGYISKLHGRAYIESSYHYYGCLDILPLAFLDFKAAFIVRDPRDWIRSWINRGVMYHRHDIHLRINNRPTPRLVNDRVYEQGWKKTGQFEKLCWAWNYLNAYALDGADGISQIRICRFEDLFASPDKCRNLSELIGFLTDLDAPMNREPENLAAAVKTALAAKINEPGNYDFPHWTDWRPEQAKKVDDICGGLMVNLGYGLEPEWKKLIS